MKTKEIDVWVDSNDPDLMEYITTDELCNYFKAKLIIELPEKKVKITESVFDEAWGKSIKEYNEAERYYVMKQMLGLTDETE